MNPLPRLPWFEAHRSILRAMPVRGTHALLLYGPRGIGKKSLALDLARDALCEQTTHQGACGHCDSCRLIDSGNHPDFRLVLPESLSAWRTENVSDESEEGAIVSAEQDEDASEAKRESRDIRIDQIRALTGFFEVATHRGGLRVVVLAPADALNDAAANALLKTLEEPPAGTFFILCTDAIDGVLPTIRSRCQLYRLTAPLPDQCIPWLRAHGLDTPEQWLDAAGGAPLEALTEASDTTIQSVLTALLERLKEGSRLDMGRLIGLKIPKSFPSEAAIRLFQRWGWDLLAHQKGGAIRYHPSLQSDIEQLSARIDSASALLAWQQYLTRLRAESMHPALNVKALIEEALIGYRRLFAV